MWALLVHKVTGGKTVVPDEPEVIQRHEALDWERADFPEGIDASDPRAVDSLADFEAGNFEPIGSEKTGSVAEESEHSEENEAELADTTTQEGVE